MPKLAEAIRLSPALEGDMKELIVAVKESGLEGLVAKRKDSIYEPGLRVLGVGCGDAPSSPVRQLVWRVFDISTSCQIPFVERRPKPTTEAMAS